MWTLENRPKYNRDHLRYPSDLTDDEWAYVAPLIPPPKPGGGRRRTDMRAVMNGVMYILSTGCQWRYLPKDFPPYSTVHHYFVWWHCDGVLDRIHHAFYVACREKLFADSAYQGPIFANGLAKILPRLETEIVKRSAHAKGFVQLPKRWIVERTIAWLNRCRRLAKDWENLNRNALAFLKLASIRLMLRKLCNP